jgi:hypothetical protein
MTAILAAATLGILLEAPSIRAFCNQYKIKDFVLTYFEEQ